MVHELARCGAVIVAHARVDLAKLCVDSLRVWLPRDRIVAVVNLPAAIDPIAWAALAADTIVVSPSAPQGYGANLNLGVAALPDGVEYCVLANDDLVFGDESLPLLVRALERDARTAVVGPRLVNADGSEAMSFSAFPSLSEAIENGTILPRPLWLARERRRAVRPAAAEPPVDWVVGAALLVRLAAFGEVGGFDEDFVLNCEDVDFCYRIGRAGWTIAWCPDATVTHLKGSSIPGELNFAYFLDGLRLFFRKRLGPVRWTLLEGLLLALFGLSVAYSVVASLVRPRTARYRYSRLRTLWRDRLFLVRSRLDVPLDVTTSASAAPADPASRTG